MHMLHMRIANIIMLSRLFAINVCPFFQFCDLKYNSFSLLCQLQNITKLTESSIPSFIEDVQNFR